MSRPRSPQRTLAAIISRFHNLVYFTPELRRFDDVGIDEYWHAYMAHRSAPLGRPTAPVVEATFYNFAPRMVREAIPRVWDLIAPPDAIALRDEAMTTALDEHLGRHLDDESIASTADVAADAVLDCSCVGRPLFGAHAALPLPDHPLLRLWYATTLWREYRGDAHNIALTAAEIDGLEAHVLLGAKGVVKAEAIERIRGWTLDEWGAAIDRLAERGYVEPGDTRDALAFTPAGEQLHRSIESETDRLARGPLEALGPDDVESIIAVLGPLADELVERGAVPGKWPPPNA